MQRITISIDDQLAAAFDRFIEQRGYGNRSEAVRDLIRDRLDDASLTTADTTHCVASLSYVYDHHERALAEKLTAAQHAHHDLTVASMHVHLDHHNCLETVILQGATSAVRQFAAQLTAAPGVRHGALNLVGVESAERHTHTGTHDRSAHHHLKPKF
jgi:CopG family nickel-responsive transcriptional regulator